MMFTTKRRIDIAKLHAAKVRRHCEETRSTIERLRASGKDTAEIEAELAAIQPTVERFERHVQSMQEAFAGEGVRERSG